MARRTKKITSDAAAADIAAQATRLIEPPGYMDLSKTELAFFNSIIDEMPVADWSEHQIECAALLAGTMAGLDRARKVFRNARKASAQNEALKQIQVLSSSVYAGRRSLGLHARALGGEARDIAKRKAIGKKIEESVRDPFGDDDGLLAQPKH